MTDAEQKAVERVNDARRRNFLPVLSAQTITGSVSFPALRYAIEDHERFRKEVSDALIEFYGGYSNALGEPLERFILPPKADSLVDALEEVWGDAHLSFTPEAGDLLRASLAKRGGRIVFDD